MEIVWRRLLTVLPGAACLRSLPGTGDAMLHVTHKTFPLPPEKRAPCCSYHTRPPEEFGQALVNQMDRSFLTRAGALGRGASRREQTAQLVSARQAGPSYLVSYTVSPVDLAPRAVTSVVTPGSHKRRSRLYTLNLSAPAEERERWEPVFSGVLQSFSVPRA